MTKAVDYCPTAAYRPVDHQLRQEKETIEDTQIGLKDALFRRRQEALGTARQQEREKGEYYLEAIVGLAFSFVYLFYHETSSYAHTMQSHRLQVAQDEFKASLLSQQNVVPPSEPREPSVEQPDQLIAVSIYPSRLFSYYIHINLLQKREGYGEESLCPLQET